MYLKGVMGERHFKGIQKYELILGEPYALWFLVHQGRR